MKQWLQRTCMLYMYMDTKLSILTPWMLRHKVATGMG
jgi:hypothetical protein